MNMKVGRGWARVGAGSVVGVGVGSGSEPRVWTSHGGPGVDEHGHARGPGG